ncbi:hypothetical protein TNCT_636951 [Trichonephila clavata]|uniref:Uncharacterized protein n=1 Tax=Trichonephila clavata TaxID=2740835 RepID=A0A8X6GUQ3_TRICU|nr:hypothetical protein TNCT_636951 [Trichonephila clavata]
MPLPAFAVRSATGCRCLPLLLFNLLQDVVLLCVRSAADVTACLCCWICYRMSLPAFAVRSATGCRCLPLLLLFDMLPDVVACFAVRSATRCRCLSLMLMYLTLDLLSDGHCLPSFTLDTPFFLSLLACCADVTTG